MGRNLMCGKYDLKTMSVQDFDIFCDEHGYNMTSEAYSYYLKTQNFFKVLRFIGILNPDAEFVLHYAQSESQIEFVIDYTEMLKEHPELTKILKSIMG